MKIRYDKLYISTTSDEASLNSEIIRELIKLPNATLFLEDEIKTIQFGSTCKHVVLSHGSFSACIGWLSFFSNIYWSEIDESKRWCGNMFIENDACWNKILLSECN